MTTSFRFGGARRNPLPIRRLSSASVACLCSAGAPAGRCSEQLAALKPPEARARRGVGVVHGLRLLIGFNGLDLAAKLLEGDASASPGIGVLVVVVERGIEVVKRGLILPER